MGKQTTSPLLRHLGSHPDPKWTYPHACSHVSGAEVGPQGRGQQMPDQGGGWNRGKAQCISRRGGGGRGGKEEGGGGGGGRGGGNKGGHGRLLPRAATVS